MTTVTFLKKKKDIIGFEVVGHTGYGMPGKDIVCSAISTAAQATYIGLSQAADIECYAISKPGYFHMYVTKPLDGVPALIAEIMFRTLEIVVDELVAQYDKFIKVCTKEM